MSNSAPMRQIKGMAPTPKGAKNDAKKGPAGVKAKAPVKPR